MQSDHAQLEHSEVKPQALSTTRSDGYRTERTVWIVMLALPLLAYCVVAVLTFSIKPVPINTSDALYERFLGWVATNFVDRFYANRSDPTNSTLWYSHTYQYNDPFADWEAEFGDDPRYWMLRYWSSSREKYGWYGHRQPLYRHLRRARELGAADGAILLTMLESIDSNLRTRSHLNIPPANVGRYNRARVDEQTRPEHDRILAELLAVAGNESLPHYYAALCDTQRNDFTAAMAHIEDGNRAENNTSLVGFPFDKLLAEPQVGKPLPDKITYSSALFDRNLLPFHDLTQFEYMVQALTPEAISREDPAALDELHTFSCRMGSAANSSYHSAIIAEAMVCVVATAGKRNFGNSLSSEQANNLSQLSKIMGQAKSLSLSGSAIPPANNPLAVTKIQELIHLMEAKLSGGRAPAVRYLETMHNRFRTRQNMLNEPIRQLFEQMESFNYNTLEFE